MSITNITDRERELAFENSKLRTVMVAAAEEIHAHWEAHCDAEGYGPANLMHRLERGIAAEYGYTAGRFAELEAENERLKKQLVENDKVLDEVAETLDAAALEIKRLKAESTKLREAAKLGLEALEYFSKDDAVDWVSWDESRGSEAITALKEALGEK